MAKTLLERALADQKRRIEAAEHEAEKAVAEIRAEIAEFHHDLDDIKVAALVRQVKSFVDEFNYTYVPDRKTSTVLRNMALNIRAGFSRLSPSEQQRFVNRCMTKRLAKIIYEL